MLYFELHYYDLMQLKRKNIFRVKYQSFVQRIKRQFTVPISNVNCFVSSCSDTVLIQTLLTALIVSVMYFYEITILQSVNLWRAFLYYRTHIRSHTHTNACTNIHNLQETRLYEAFRKCFDYAFNSSTSL